MTMMRAGLRGAVWGEASGKGGRELFSGKEHSRARGGGGVVVYGGRAGVMMGKGDSGRGGANMIHTRGRELWGRDIRGARGVVIWKEGRAEVCRQGGIFLAGGGGGGSQRKRGGKVESKMPGGMGGTGGGRGRRRIRRRRRRRENKADILIKLIMGEYERGRKQEGQADKSYAIKSGNYGQEGGGRHGRGAGNAVPEKRENNGR